MSNIGRVRPIVRQAPIIASMPTVAELSLHERVNLIRPYLALVFYVIALTLVIGLSRRLYQRYRKENIVETKAQPMDRRSLRKRNK